MYFISTKQDHQSYLLGKKLGYLSAANGEKLPSLDNNKAFVEGWLDGFDSYFSDQSSDQFSIQFRKRNEELHQEWCEGGF